MFAVYEALSRGVTIGELHRLTKIDEWFLAKLWNLASMERRLREDKLTPELYYEAQKMGYPDKAIRPLERTGKAAACPAGRL